MYNLKNKYPKIYLSGPMDGIPLSESRSWRDYVTKKLKKFKIETHDPTKSVNDKFLKVKKALVDFELKELENDKHDFTPRSIVVRDLKDLNECDMILVNMTLNDQLEGKKIPLGTSMEMIMAAETYRMPVIGVTNCLVGRPWWDGVVDKSYKTLDEAVDCIVGTFKDNCCIIPKK